MNTNIKLSDSEPGLTLLSGPTLWSDCLGLGSVTAGRGTGRGRASLVIAVARRALWTGADMLTRQDCRARRCPQSVLVSLSAKQGALVFVSVLLSQSCLCGTLMCTERAL